MTWQIKYALENIGANGGRSTAAHLRGEIIRITTQDQPDVVAAISADETISREIAEKYHKEEPDLDFLCGFRKACVWEGAAITYLTENCIGWGNPGTLYSAAEEGNANTSEHKVFLFANRLIRQHSSVEIAEREFDRIYLLTLKNGRGVRIGLIAEYEPTADVVRSLWDKFGPVELIWNINPNGNPTLSAIQAGSELGCEVVKWKDLTENLKKT